MLKWRVDDFQMNHLLVQEAETLRLDPQSLLGLVLSAEHLMITGSFSASTGTAATAMVRGQTPITEVNGGGNMMMMMDDAPCGSNGQPISTLPGVEGRAGRAQAFIQALMMMPTKAGGAAGARGQRMYVGGGGSSTQQSHTHLHHHDAPSSSAAAAAAAAHAMKSLGAGIDQIATAAAQRLMQQQQQQQAGGKVKI